MVRPSPAIRIGLRWLALLVIVGLGCELRLAPLSAQSFDEDWERLIDQDIRDALTGADYPWYDSDSDQGAKLIPPPPPEPYWWQKLWDRFLRFFEFNPRNAGNSSNFTFGLGELLMFLLYALLAAGLITLLVFAVRRYQRWQGTITEAQAPSIAIRYEAGQGIAGLFGDAIEADSDPWETAKRKRDQGRLGEAVAALFAHLLTLLERTGAIQVAPGRTPRQLVRSLGEPLTRSQVQPTLNLFEAFAFGHRGPDPDAFAFAWSEAETLRSRLLNAIAKEDSSS